MRRNRREGSFCFVASSFGIWNVRRAADGLKRFINLAFFDEAIHDRQTQNLG